MCFVSYWKVKMVLINGDVIHRQLLKRDTEIRQTIARQD